MILKKEKNEMKVKIPDFPHSEKEFTQPADKLITLIEEYYIRLYGEKPDHQTVLAMCNKVLENRR